MTSYFLAMAICLWTADAQPANQVSTPSDSAAATTASALAATDATRAGAPLLRRVISLDGQWDIADGGLDEMPKAYAAKAPVPGLVDMAQPPFVDVGTAESAKHRAAFWYRRTFTVPGDVPAVAQLKLHKVKYGARVYLNGAVLGEHMPCFTPGYFDVSGKLKGGGQSNELVVRVGHARESVPRSQPDGWDFEKSRYIPGIYDSVELILSGTPHITSVQTVPLVQEKAVLVVAKVLNAARPTEIELRARVLEAKGDKEVGSAISGPIKLVGGEGRQIDLLIPIENCRLWSPEDPFLYRLELDTGCDRQSVRFGVRSFSFDPQTKMPLLNGKPYPLRGTNVCIFRFFEDSQRKDLPWREAWVRRLHKLFKEMHWNSCRYCIGFPPERWYDIADEEGILIQDEFPIWYLQQWPAELKAEALMPEYQAWMRERWNHPCVVIWDAQNETKTEETGKAIRAVRGQDLSSRPWDNGWGPPDQPTDVYEAHPYFFGGKTGTKNRLSQLGNKPGAPGVPNGLRGAPRLNTGGNPTIINEYCWLWLTRDGLPTTLTKPNYEIFLGPKSTVEERRQLYNRVLAAKTEFWRCRRQVAGVLHFCALGYSRHDGQTSDHFTDVEKLELEPNFRKYVRSAFSPVGLMVDYWAEQTPLAPLQVPVVVINDLPEAWNGRVRLELQDDKGKRVVHSAEKECSVASIGQETLSFELPAPKSPGEYLLAAKLTCAGEEVLSVREVRVEAPAPAKPAPSTAGPASPATKPPPPGKSTRPARAE